MPLIPESIIDEIQARTDIAELIGRYVPLKRAGRHFKANCPFHQEKTPSFMVNADKQIFHCFGCGVGGNIFSFLMQHDRLTFPEAVRQLADHAGVRVPEREAASDRGEQEALAALMDKVCRHFERRLRESKEGAAARAYLTRRGVSERTRESFRLGLAPAGWSHLFDAAKATGVSAEQLEAAGLIIKGKTSYYDRFRNRLMFAITDVRGRVRGFGGRSLDAQEPKYLNSPETVLYSKGRHLFGLAQAKDAMLHTKTAVVVEGYFDCVVLADGGITNVVAPLGTSLTEEQARLLKRYAETVVLAFDADAAGEQATLRSIDLLVASGLHVRVARLPEGADPDECLRDLGRERFQRLLDESAGIFDVLVEIALKYHPGSDAEQTVSAARFVLPTIAKVPDAMLRSEYVRLLADRLRLDAGAVVEELGKVQPRPQTAAAPSERRGVARSSAAPGPERLLTGLVLDEPSRWRKDAQGGLLDAITDPRLRRILGIISELQAMGVSATAAHVVSRLAEDQEVPAVLVAELVELAQSVTEKDEAFADCARRLRAGAHKRDQAQLRQQIQAAQEAGQEREVQRLLADYQTTLRGG